MTNFKPSATSKSLTQTPTIKAQRKESVFTPTLSTSTVLHSMSDFQQENYDTYKKVREKQHCQLTEIFSDITNYNDYLARNLK